MVSHPSTTRRVLAAALMIVGFGFTVVVKLTRHEIAAPVLLEIANALPNFVCGAVLPLAILMSPRSFRFAEFLQFAGLILLGLVLYEAAQIWLPRRTFQWSDILSSVLGTAAAIVLGLVFFRWDKTGGNT